MRITNETIKETNDEINRYIDNPSIFQTDLKILITFYYLKIYTVLKRICKILRMNISFKKIFKNAIIHGINILITIFICTLTWCNP